MSNPSRERNIRAEAEAAVPVTVLTGFLGSGKTTLLNALLRHPDMDETAVLVNEFGEVGLDHLLVRRIDESVILLNAGCLCCTVRGDLVDSLRDLFLKRVKGEVPEFRRVAIETTGLADPAPVIHTLMTDPLIGARYRLDGIVTTVDAVHGAGQLDGHPESVKQAAVADRLVLTKTDLTDEAHVADLLDSLHHLNPAAPVIVADHGDVAPDAILDSALFNPRTKTPQVQDWLRAEAYEDPHGAGHHDHDHDHDHDHGRLDRNRHDARIGAFCVTLDEPVPWAGFVTWLEMLLAARGENVLRVKGILNVADEERPVAVHGVQHVFHPPVALPDWPDDDRRSRLVLITRDLGRDAVEATLHAFLGATADQPAAAPDGPPVTPGR